MLGRRSTSSKNSMTGATDTAALQMRTRVVTLKFPTSVWRHQMLMATHSPGTMQLAIEADNRGASSLCFACHHCNAHRGTRQKNTRNSTGHTIEVAAVIVRPCHTAFARGATEEVVGEISPNLETTDENLVYQVHQQEDGRGCAKVPRDAGCRENVFCDVERLGKRRSLKDLTSVAVHGRTKAMTVTTCSVGALHTLLYGGDPARMPAVAATTLQKPTAPRRPSLLAQRGSWASSPCAQWGPWALSLLTSRIEIP